MKNQIISEFRKLRTVRSTWGLLVGALLLVAVGVIAVLWEGTSASLAAPVTSQPLVRVSLSVTWFFTLILGLRSFTDEFRNGSIVPTLLAEPHRRRVLVSKLAVLGTTIAVFTVAAAALTLAIGLPWLATKGIAIDASAGPIAVWLGRLLLINVLFSAIGIGVGLAVRHQVAAIVGSIVMVTLVENLLDGLAPALGRYLPTAATWSLAGFDGAFMGPAGGALVLGAWAAGAVGLGAALMDRRDIA